MCRTRNHHNTGSQNNVAMVTDPDDNSGYLAGLTGTHTAFFCSESMTVFTC